MPPRASIIIPAYNAAATIACAARACAAQDIGRENIEVIVVDDGSTDGTAAAAEAAGAVVLRQEHAGPARARNHGAENAAGGYLLFTDADCAPPPDWARRLVEACDAPGVAASGGSYTLLNGDSLLARCIHADILFRHRRMREDAVFLGSYNLCVRREVFTALGGFDTAYSGAHVEDIDFSYRMLAAGHKLRFRKDIAVGHRHESRLGRFLRQQFWRAFWRVRLYRTHPGRIGGDGYTSALDYAQAASVGFFFVEVFAFLLLMIVTCRFHAGDSGMIIYSPFFLLGAFAGFLFILLSAISLGLFFLLSLPQAIFTWKEMRPSDALLWIPINFMRNIAWLPGAGWGVLRLPFMRRK